MANNQLPEAASKLLDELIEEGEQYWKNTVTPQNVIAAKHPRDKYGYADWLTRVTLFRETCSEVVGSFACQLQWEYKIAEEAHKLHSTLKTIRRGIDGGLFRSYKEQVLSEAMADLFEQGEHLLDKGYCLAAAVVFRAVLEERLRTLCEAHDCMPEQERPGIEGYSKELGKTEPPILTRTDRKHVTHLAGIGNDAAHNKPAFSQDNVPTMRGNLLAFLAKFEPTGSVG